MIELVVAAALFVGTHLGISSTPLRAVLVDKLGRRYVPFYAVIALATLAYLIVAYTSAPTAQVIWGPSTALRWVPLLLMPVVFVFLLGGFLVRNPTSIGFEDSVGDEARGLLRITRHPFQWGVVIWAGAHIVANGDPVALVFFGSLGTLSVVGTMAIDRKKAIQLGDAWGGFADTTSNVPFAAIVAGRNRLVWRELWLPVAVGGCGYAVVLWGHEWVSGVPLL